MMRRELYVTIFYCFTALLSGCSGFRQNDSVNVLISRDFGSESRSVAIIPLFEVPRKASQKVSECPITHIVSRSGSSMPKGSGETLALTLFKKIKEDSEGTLFTSPLRSFATYHENKNRSGYNLALAASIGKKLGVDAVLAGSVLRFSEREGSSWAVNQPASLAFTLVLVDVRKKEIVWSARFDQTQKPLSDNILNIKSFWNAGMKWITVNQLADNAAEALSEKLALFLASGT